MASLKEHVEAHGGHADAYECIEYAIVRKYLDKRKTWLKSQLPKEAKKGIYIYEIHTTINKAFEDVTKEFDEVKG